MKRSRRERRGFVPIGGVGLAGAGMPRRREVELRLDRAWHRAAGPAVARRVRIVGVRRGVLELECDRPEWCAVLRPEIRTLARRVARQEPSLGIRRVRLRGPTGAESAIDLGT